MSLPTVATLAGYAAITGLVPPAISAVVALLSPGVRARMPGGGARLFRALWLQGVGLAVGFLTARIIWDAIFGAPPKQTIEENLVTLACVIPASVGSAWLFRRLPLTSPLVRDLAAALRPTRPTNLGKA